MASWGTTPSKSLKVERSLRQFLVSPSFRLLKICNKLCLVVLVDLIESPVLFTKNTGLRIWCQVSLAMLLILSE